MYKCKITIFLFIAFAPVFIAQKQSNIWCFGNKAMLNFDSGTPVDISPSAMSTLEGSASIADYAGNLLFYTDGFKVWDRTHNVMPWGIGLKGDYSSSQSAIITPVIQSPNQYYIFTVAGASAQFTFPPYELNYSIVDMTIPGNGSINNPNGDVVLGSKNIFLAEGTIEKVTAIMHADSVSYWIVCPILDADTFLSFHVTCNGVDINPKISPVNTHSLSHDRTPLSIGCMNASFDGKSIVAVYQYDENGIDYGLPMMYDFDNATGIVSNSRIIGNNIEKIYGVEFSPDDQLIYVSSETQGIWQYQRFASNIITSEIKVSSIDAGSLQLANDGKIYFAKILSNSIGRIETPNTVGTPLIIDSVIVFNGDPYNYTGNYSMYGLPNFFKPYLQKDMWNFQKKFQLCVGDSVRFGPATLPGYKYLWSPSNFLSNVNISQPTANPLSTTTYYLKMINSCNDTIIDSVNVVVGNPMAIFTADPSSTSILNPTIQFIDSSFSTIGPITSWSWFFDNEESNFSDIQNPSYTCSDTGLFRVQLIVTDSIGCKDTSYSYIRIYPPTFEYYAPNSFTPNNDGINDVFSVRTSIVNGFEMFIFDRWGNLVFNTTDSNHGWDGSLDISNLAQQDVYTYLVKLSNYKNEKHIFNGRLTLIR